MNTNNNDDGDADGEGDADSNDNDNISSDKNNDNENDADKKDIDKNQKDNNNDKHESQYEHDNDFKQDEHVEHEPENNKANNTTNNDASLAVDSKNVSKIVVVDGFVERTADHNTAATRDKDFKALEQLSTTSSSGELPPLPTQKLILNSNPNSSQSKNREQQIDTQTTNALTTTTASSKSHSSSNSLSLVDTQPQPKQTSNKQKLTSKHNSNNTSNSSNSNRNSSSSSSCSNNNSSSATTANRDLSVENNIDSGNVKLTSASSSKIFHLNLTDNNNVSNAASGAAVAAELKSYNINLSEVDDDMQALLQKSNITNPFYPCLLRKQASSSLKELRRLKRRKLRYLRRIRSEADLSVLSKQLISGTEHVVVVLDGKPLACKPNSYVSKLTTTNTLNTTSSASSQNRLSGSSFQTQEGFYNFSRPANDSSCSSTVITNPFSIFHDDDTQALTLSVNTRLRASSSASTTSQQRPIKKHRSERSLKRLYELEQKQQKQPMLPTAATPGASSAYYYGGLPVSRFERQDFHNQQSSSLKAVKPNAKKSKAVFKNFALKKLQLKNEKTEQLDPLPPQLKKLRISYPNSTQSINSLQRATQIGNKAHFQSSIVGSPTEPALKHNGANYFERLQAKTKQGIQKIREKCRNFKGNATGYSETGGSSTGFNTLAKDESFRFISDRAHMTSYETQARAAQAGGKQATIYKSYKSEIDLTRNLQYLDAYLEENFDQSLSSQQKSAHSVGRVTGARMAAQRRHEQLAEEMANYAQPAKLKGNGRQKRNAQNYENVDTLPLKSKSSRQQHMRVHSDSMSSSDYASVFSGPTTAGKPTSQVPTYETPLIGVTNTAFSLNDEPSMQSASLRYEHPKMSEYFLEHLPTSYALEFTDPEAAESLLRENNFYEQHLLRGGEVGEMEESIRILVNDVEDDDDDDDEESDNAEMLTGGKAAADWYQSQARNFRACTYNENLAESDFYRSLNQHLRTQQEMADDEDDDEHHRLHAQNVEALAAAAADDYADFQVKAKQESYLAHYQRHQRKQAIETAPIPPIDYDNEAARFYHYAADTEAVDAAAALAIDKSSSRQGFGDNFEFQVTTAPMARQQEAPGTTTTGMQRDSLIAKRRSMTQSLEADDDDWSPAMLMTAAATSNATLTTSIDNRRGVFVAVAACNDSNEAIIGNLRTPVNVRGSYKGSRYINDEATATEDYDNEEGNDETVVGCNYTMLNSMPATYLSKSPSSSSRYKYQQQHCQKPPQTNSVNSSSLSASSSSTSSMSHTNQTKLQQNATGNKQYKYAKQQQPSSQHHHQYQQRTQNYSVRRNSSASNASSNENFDNFITLRGSSNIEPSNSTLTATTRSSLPEKSILDYKNAKQRNNLYETAYKQSQQPAPAYQRGQQLLPATSPTSSSTPLTTALNYYGNYIGSPGAGGVGGSASESLYTASSTNSGSSTAASSTSSSSHHGVVCATTPIAPAAITAVARGNTNSKLSMTPTAAVAATATSLDLTSAVAASSTGNITSTSNNHTNALQTILSQVNLVKSNVAGKAPLLPPTAIMTPTQQQQQQQQQPQQSTLSTLQFAAKGGGSLGSNFILEYEC